MMDQAEFIQILVAAPLTFVQKVLLTMTDEEREKREQAIIACTNAIHDIDPNSVFCNITIGISCWPATRAGGTAEVQCFAHRFTNPKQKATRDCTENGTWSKARFLDCFKEDEVVVQERDRREVVRTIFDIGYPITCVALMIAIAIFLYFKTLRCMRNFIHCNLMLAMLISDIKYIIFSHAGMKLESESHHGCKLFVFFMIYFNTSIFFWMFIEGFYLLTIVVWTFRAHKIHLWHFLLFGWGTPLAVTSIYAVAMANYDTENVCWLPVYKSKDTVNIYTIIVATVSILLVINIIIVGTVVWILCHKLRGSTAIEVQQVRKASRAIVVLLPLLGLHFMFTYILEFLTPSVELYFFYIRNFLQSIQGILVATFYCFLNSEVHTAVRQKVSVILEQRSIKTSMSNILSGKKSGHSSAIRSSNDNKELTLTLYDKKDDPQVPVTPTDMRKTSDALTETSAV